MFQSGEIRKHVSRMLSEVLDDIGINKRMRLRAQRVFMLMETMTKMLGQSMGVNTISFLLGSRSEGTTTSGLKSDTDELICLQDCNVIQDWSEWEYGKINYFMIQDENTTPGYCFLQLLKEDEPLPATVIPNNDYITDRRGRILHRNTFENLNHGIRHGPSIAILGQHGLMDHDQVLCYPCKSWPKSAASCWLERQDTGEWPTQKMRRNVARTRCYVVPTESKVSKSHELEWRISTSLAERCLMFDLNITQIRCYVLMKMILKSSLNPQGKINITSFMCKTVLLHCIENKVPSMWEENNLLECLKVCLNKLHSCVQDGILSHFIIPENNLFAGQFTAESKHQLLKKLSDFIQNDVPSLLYITIDNLGKRLKIKLDLLREAQNNFCSSSVHHCEGSVCYLGLSTRSSNYHSIYLNDLQNNDIGKMKQYVENLMTYKCNGSELEHDALPFLAPFLFTTYGSALASASIGLTKQVSPQALVWLLDGFDSDVSSGRLKLASVFYSAGDMEKTELILSHTESQYYSYPVVPSCSCSLRVRKLSEKFLRVCYQENEDCVKHITAFCVRFIQQEINCVPHELQYEMFKSTQGDMKHTDKKEFWMNLIVVDSQPFLYFLQYQVYRHLQRYQDQQQALRKLANIIQTDTNLNHKDTALNVLGQCMEQENRPKQALKCYLLSLQQRARNNVARIHICRLLFGVLVDKEGILDSRK